MHVTTLRSLFSRFQSASGVLLAQGVHELRPGSIADACTTGGAAHPAAGQGGGWEPTMPHGPACRVP